MDEGDRTAIHEVSYGIDSLFVILHVQEVVTHLYGKLQLYVQEAVTHFI